MTKPKVEVGKWEDRKAHSASGHGPKTAFSKLDSLAWLLDSSVQIPGTRWRVGLDAFIGMIPVLGDAIGAALSTYIMIMAAKMGIPRVTLLRMGFNVSLEAVVGLIPFVGDLFDFAWKANRRNVDLLRAHLENPSQARKGDWLFAAVFILFSLAVLGSLGWGAFAILGHLRGAIAG
ncbi:MAG: DUF4112 domain-containing protein [Fibrobacterota bacterium]|nr:DUF4112 domain-containing protein [Fibrobacterota bacterium]